jgi:hypothetical protein
VTAYLLEIMGFAFAIFCVYGLIERQQSRHKRSQLELGYKTGDPDRASDRLPVGQR